MFLKHILNKKLSFDQNDGIFSKKIFFPSLAGFGLNKSAVFWFNSFLVIINVTPTVAITEIIVASAVYKTFISIIRLGKSYKLPYAAKSTWAINVLPNSVPIITPMIVADNE